VEGIVTNGISKCRNQFRSLNGSTGLIPDTTVPGDLICMLGDAEIPFVLRPNHGEFKIIGDAYIEMADDDVDRPLMVQTFGIR
jgi:hypothetical protein